MQKWFLVGLFVWSRVGHTTTTQVDGVMLTGWVPKLLLNLPPQTEYTFFSRLLPCWDYLLGFRIGLDRNKPSPGYPANSPYLLAWGILIYKTILACISIRPSFMFLPV